MANEQRIVQQIIKRYGDVINLKERPDVIIDILRSFRISADDDGPDGGLPPGGTPPPPPPSPDPSDIGIRVTLDDIMREVLKLSRTVAKLDARIAAPKTAAKATAAAKPTKRRR